MLDQAAGVAAGELGLRRIELDAVAMTGHRNIGQVPVHRLRCQHKGPVDRRPLRLVDRGGVAVVEGLVGLRRDRDRAQGLRPRFAVEPNLYGVRLDRLNRSQHPVLHSELPVVLEEDDTVARREQARSIGGLETNFAGRLAAGECARILKRGANGVVDRPDVRAPVRRRDPGPIRSGVAIGEIVPHDRRPRCGSVRLDAEGPMSPISGEPLPRPMAREGDRGLPLPVDPLATDFGELGMTDLLRDGPERRPGSDRLQLLMIADDDDLRAPQLGLADEPGELPASDHARLVHHQNVARPEKPPVVPPAHVPGRERAALDPRGFLEALGRLAGQGRPMNPIALRLPGLPRRKQHGGLAGAGEADDSRDPLRPSDMSDRRTLFVRQTRPTAGLTPGESRVLTPDRRLDMPPVDAMRARRLHPLRRARHAALDLDHLAGGITRRRNLPRLRVCPLRLKRNQRRRRHDRGESVLERLNVVVDGSVQRPRNVAPVEHALLVGDEGKNLLRLLPDQLHVAPRRLGVQPGAANLHSAPLHLGRMDAHVLGRLDFESPLPVRPMVDPDIEPGPRQPLIGDLLPRLANVPELNVGRGQTVGDQPFVLPLDSGLVAEPSPATWRVVIITWAWWLRTSLG